MNKKAVRKIVTVQRFRVQRFPLKAGLKMLIFPGYCQFSFKFWIRPDEADTFLKDTEPKGTPGTRIEP